MYLVRRVPQRTGGQVWPAWEIALAPQAPERQRYGEYAADLEVRQWRLRGAAAGEGLLRTALDAAHRLALRVWVLLFGLRVVLRGFARTSRSVPTVPATVTGAR